MSDQSTKLFVGLVPLPGIISVFFRAGTKKADAIRFIKKNGGTKPIPREKTLGTGYYVTVPVGQELEFARKFSRLIETRDATVEYIKKEKE